MRNCCHAGLAAGAEGQRRQREPFRVEIRPDRRALFVVPRGELDIDTVGVVAAEVDDLAARGLDRIVIDLRATSFIDSSGIHLLLRCGRRADARITVIDGAPAIGRVFDLAGVRALIPFEDAP